MKFSIITPEHRQDNFPYLLELYDSILAQTYENWEWVIYTNGDVTPDNLPPRIKQDERVKVFQDLTDNTKVGYIKNRAFHLGSGDVLVEVDHDDAITPDCLEELYKAYSSDSSIGFVYSNTAVYKMDGDFIPYREDHGWSYTTFSWKGMELYAMDAFPPTSHAMSFIWYAPDHIRTWKASLYREIGGHDPAYDICDDQELMYRTFLNTKMHHIPKTLYIYRITGQNTWLERNQGIQELTVDLFDFNIRKLVAKEADEKGLLKVDIGGGLNPFPGYKTVDIRETADYVADLNEGIPLPDNSVWALNAHHVLEHLKDPIHSMREIHRVLAHGGWAFIEVPSTDGRGAFQDPTHITFWNDNSFLYYTDKELATFIDNTDIRFQEMKKTNYYPNARMEELDVLVTCAVLVAVKNDDERLPGPLSI